jgi:polyhydroxyalkanoate synthesis regulator protein
MPIHTKDPQNHVPNEQDKTRSDEMLKKMHNKKLCNTYSSPNITVDELTGNVAWMQRMRNAYMILVIKPEDFGVD